MQKWFTIIVVLLLGFAPALAAAQNSINSGNASGPGNNNTQNSATGGQGGSSSVGINNYNQPYAPNYNINQPNQGQNQGQSINDSGNSRNRNINRNDNTNVNVNENRNSNRNTNRQSQGQGQLQGQRQGQGQGQGQVNQPQQTISGDSYNVEAPPRQAPPAIAPNLTAVPETCMGSAAVGASTPFGGVSFGSTYKSEDCELRMYARALMALGKNDAALALLAQNAKVAEALRATGTKAAWLKDEKDQSPALAAQAQSHSAVATVPSTPFTQSP